jgi:chromate transporter
MLLLDARPTLHWPTRREPKRPPDAGGGTTLHAWSPALLLPALLGPAAAGGTRLALGLFFLQTGALVFGSGLAIVPLLRDSVVAQHHWLTQGQFLDADAMGLITPGLVVITAGFIGYLDAGLPGAVTATLAIFTPIYLAMVIPDGG